MISAQQDAENSREVDPLTCAGILVESRLSRLVFVSNFARNIVADPFEWKADESTKW